MKKIRDTSTLSLNQIKEKLPARHRMCINALSEFGDDGATANELAMKLFSQGYTSYFNRNFVHPRLNELVELGIIKTDRKKKDPFTNRACIVYRFVSEKDFNI